MQFGSSMVFIRSHKIIKTLKVIIGVLLFLCSFSVRNSCGDELIRVQLRDTTNLAAPSIQTEIFNANNSVELINCRTTGKRQHITATVSETAADCISFHHVQIA